MPRTYVDCPTSIHININTIRTTRGLTRNVTFPSSKKKRLCRTCGRSADFDSGVFAFTDLSDDAGGFTGSPSSEATSLL